VIDPVSRDDNNLPTYSSLTGSAGYICSFWISELWSYDYLRLEMETLLLPGEVQCTLVQHGKKIKEKILFFAASCRFFRKPKNETRLRWQSGKGRRSRGRGGPPAHANNTSMLSGSQKPPQTPRLV